MKLRDHAKHTKKLYGISAEDIHKWIDGFFDRDGFDHFVQTGRSPSDPYDHRQFRHCKEALEEAFAEFEGLYTREQIKNIFETHIKDDYDGYVPKRKDFIDGTFTHKYHENDEHSDAESILTHTELSEYFKGNLSNYKNKKRDDSNFYIKILLPTAIAIVLFIASIFTIIIPVSKHNMMTQKREMIKELTASAISVMDYYIAQEDSGAMTRFKAQAEAVRAIKSMRYGVDNKDYFWVTDMLPKMVMHPYRIDLTDKDLTNYKDSKNKSGKKLFVEFVNLVNKKNEGYLEYQWQWMDDSSKTVPKLSYVRGVPKWGLIVGTGVYINDIEEEIWNLQIDLLLAFTIISVVLLLFLANILWQSKKIEGERVQAEQGLMEAKERYRALVEGSSEGYILEVEGKIVYSNRTIQRMLEYSETEIADDLFINRLFSDLELNSDAIEHLSLLFRKDIEPGQFQAQILTKSNKTLDVILTSSKIFFSKKNGHVVSFRTIVGKKSIAPSNVHSISMTHSELSSSITEQIEGSQSMGHIIQSLNKLPLLIRDMLDNGTNSDNLRRAIGTAYDTSIVRIIGFSIDELGPPPASFSFLSLGSAARHEMTMFSDQDNALIFSDVDEDKLHDTRRYFLNLSNRVCKMLDQAGYPYCPGDIMAVNPKWCLSLSEWKENFRGWVMGATPENILDINVFFDLYNTYGDHKLFEDLKSYMYEVTKKNPLFFSHYARNCLLYRAPLNLFGQIKTKNDSLNLKECLRPIELFARIYALKYDIPHTNTLIRLHMLVEKNIITDQSYQEMIYVFDFIWHLRFRGQIGQHSELLKVNDKINLSTLNDVERQNLKNVLGKITSFQTMLSYDFFGTPIG